MIFLEPRDVPWTVGLTRAARPARHAHLAPGWDANRSRNSRSWTAPAGRGAMRLRRMAPSGGRCANPLAGATPRSSTSSTPRCPLAMTPRPRPRRPARRCAASPLRAASPTSSFTWTCPPASASAAEFFAGSARDRQSAPSSAHGPLPRRIGLGRRPASHRTAGMP